MKIAIVTTYTSTNCGSYFQAAALHKVIKSYGYDVGFLDIHNNVFSRYLIESIKSRAFRKGYYLIRGRLKFEKYYKEMPVIRNEVLGDSLVIYGSDEIWNVTRKIFCREAFWGTGIANRKIAYATSVASAEKEDFEENAFLVSGVKDFKTLLVRDTHTQEVLYGYFGKESEVVLDPTMLFTQKDYEKGSILRHYKGARYLLVYLVDEENVLKHIRSIKRFARANCVKVVSLSWYKAWADENLFADPELFLDLFLHAEYIITNTYHGVCFSINFGKNVAFIRGRKKVNDVVDRFHMNDRFIDSPEDVFRVLNTEIDYMLIEQFLDEERCKSRNLLLNAIQELDDGH